MKVTSEAHSCKVPTTGMHILSCGLLSNDARRGITPDRLISCLFFLLLLKLHNASAPHRATSTSLLISTLLNEWCGLVRMLSNNATSCLMPLCRRTTLRARLNLATFAIVSAARHFKSLSCSSNMRTIVCKPPKSAIERRM